MKTLEQVNALKAAEFEKIFGDVAEHSPWVARNAAGVRPFKSREAMINVFRDVVHSASETAKLALIRAHPDLATKAKLTDDSTREQAQAALGTLSREEFSRFTHLNDLYKSKFDFPSSAALPKPKLVGAPGMIARFKAHDSSLRFGSLNHFRGDTFNGKTEFPKLSANQTHHEHGRAGAVDP